MISAPLPADSGSPALPELTAYLDALPEPHILFDRQYRIVAANAAYRRQFGQGAPVVGRTCHEVSHHSPVPCDQAGETCPLARSVLSGQRERVLHLHHTPRGEDYVQIELVPLRDARGQPSYFLEKMEPLPIAQSRADAQGMIGRSPPFQAVLELIARVGPSQASVLLLGESGTGKELAARAVHQASHRASRALVAVDCASLPETLFESELFGHEKGAFTGAHAARAGLVEAAHGGTLFLDEVGDIPMTMQVKLLRLLESGTYRRVGQTELRRADIRVVAATHRNLKAMVAEGRFREDLYYRLSTFPILLPALRDRAEDIALLAHALLERVAPGRALAMAPAAMRRLAQHPFPGNVRELRNVLERAALLTDGAIVTAPTIERSLAFDAFDGSGAQALVGVFQGAAGPHASHARRDATLRSVEDAALRLALSTTAATRQELARALGISTRTLYRKLRALGDQSGVGENG
ncbi:sigma-54 interaction domain-containing protein [Acidovorax radicis]|uniref:sigma-54 interaction domain-containing protein n=1 Tax=Acidovorax radicis TaxID=758826 RepID=UPI001CF85F46|nr:sigma-54-dependent Fis family transcriptional regulator [Acidovorax radicis]UCU99437.1 sigma-54-dependent Fis family transcriptional regulator [Acidovorax radicis]